MIKISSSTRSSHLVQNLIVDVSYLSKSQLCLLLLVFVTMAGLVAYLIAGAIFFLVALLFLMMTRSSSESNSKLTGRPVLEKSAVVSTFASSKIRATPDEVFSAITDYSSYPTWSPFAIYEWKDTDEKGVPLVGSTGNFKV